MEIKDYNFMTDEKNLFDQSVKNNLRKYENIRNIAPGPGNGYTTSFLRELQLS